ncbi:MAG: hypothetical protein RI988_3468 [Pseudomonadota bacterium]
MIEQHTPGPWRVIHYDAGDRPYRDHNGPCPGIFASEEQDCSIVHWDGFKQKHWSSANGNQKQIEANARLIAAAPSLLKALEDLLASDLVRLGWLPLPGTPDFPEMSLSLRERAAPIFAARAAIAAARLHNPQTQESGE